MAVSISTLPKRINKKNIPMDIIAHLYRVSDESNQLTGILLSIYAHAWFRVSSKSEK